MKKVISISVFTLLLTFESLLAQQPKFTVGLEAFRRIEHKNYNDPAGYIIDELPYTRSSYGLRLGYYDPYSKWAFFTGVYRYTYHDDVNAWFPPKLPPIYITYDVNSGLQIPMRVKYRIIGNRFSEKAQTVIGKFDISTVGGIYLATIHNSRAYSTFSSAVTDPPWYDDQIVGEAISSPIRSMNFGAEAGLELCYRISDKFDFNYTFIRSFGFSKIHEINVEYKKVSTDENFNASITSNGSGSHHVIGISYKLPSKYKKNLQEAPKATIEKKRVIQDSDVSVYRVQRFMFLNPGFESEMPLSKKSTFSTRAGIGYGGSYPMLTDYYSTGFLYMIAPFLDLQFRKLYNREKMSAKGKNIEYNSGNFWGVKLLTRGREFKSNFIRNHPVDFSIGPRWGVQSSKKRMYLLFSTGPIYYFDPSGAQGIFPITLDLNIGYNWKSARH